jgi:hypothetical protein
MMPLSNQLLHERPAVSRVSLGHRTHFDKMSVLWQYSAENANTDCESSLTANEESAR